MVVKHKLSLTHVTPDGEISFSFDQCSFAEKKIDCSEVAYSYFKDVWNMNLINEQEEVCVLLVNERNEYINHRVIHRGGTHQCQLDIPLILRYALLHKAAGLFIAHNHPSGSLNPSNKDKVATSNLKESCDLINMVLLDHIIITESSYYSFYKGGLI